MTQIWIVWSLQGSYEDFHKSIHKVYKDELVALGERDRLNQELKDKRDRLIELENSMEGCECWMEDRYCPKCEEHDELQHYLEEQHDYTVEAFNVEGE